MSRIRLYSHNRGTAINNFKDALNETLGEQIQGTAMLLRSEGSRFRPRQGDLIINYGSSSCPITAEGEHTLLNTAEAVGRATHKRTFFQQVARYNDTVGAELQVPLCDWTVSRDEAQAWRTEGSSVVYARTVLQGHSGEGIVVVTGTDGALPNAPLFTKGITGSRREYRIHVFNGEVILVQKKQRRNGYLENPDYSDEVRNLNGGWVFGVSTANPSSAVHRAAVNAVRAIGLDFGAVDIIATGRQGNESDVYVLEINTAPGQEGDTTTQRYVAAVGAALAGQPPFSPYRNTDTIEGMPAVPQAAPVADVAPAVMPTSRPTAPVAPQQATRASEQVPPPATTEEVVAVEAVIGAHEQGTTTRPLNLNPHFHIADAIPARLRDCREEGYYLADVAGFQVPILVQHEGNGVFYTLGSEVPLEVTRLRGGLIAITA